jgi:hypothetical protein
MRSAAVFSSMRARQARRAERLAPAKLRRPRTRGACVVRGRTDDATRIAVRAGPVPRAVARGARPGRALPGGFAPAVRH